MRVIARPTGPSLAVLGALLIAALAITGFAAPGAAFADDHLGVELLPAQDPIDVGEVDSPDITVDDEPDSPPEEGDTPPVATCDDLLATVTTGGTEGNADAIAITAQSIDLGVDGWVNVGWEPVDGTTLRIVLVTGMDGTVTTVAGNQAGSATDVSSLTFCGVTEPAEEPTPDPDDTDPDETDGGDTDAGGEEPTEVVDDAEDDDAPAAPATPAPTAPQSSGSANGGANSGAGSDADVEEDAADEDEAPGVVVVEAAEPTDADDADGDATDADAVPDADGSDEDDASDDETEVLGVQLTREDEGGGGLGMGSAILIVLALTAAAGGLLWSRRA